MQFSLPLETNVISDDLPKDALSTFFEQNKKHSERKEYAQFFTHKNLVEYMIKKLNITQDSTILDPSCGAGAFLAQLQNITSNIYGIDIEKEAANLCKKNIYTNINNNIIIKNTLKDFELKNDFPKIYKDGGFDFVIGNPPFQNLKKDIDYDSKNKIYRVVSKGVVNSATLMIAKSIELLKESGYLAFVLPKNILRVDTFANLRKFLLKNTTIVSITDLGHFFKDVRGDQMIMIIKKELPNANHKIQIEILSKNSEFNSIKKYHVLQNKYNEYDIFPVFYDKGLFKIYEKFQKHKQTLNDICNGNIFRGISLDINKHMLESPDTPKQQVIYRGASIERFGILRERFAAIATDAIRAELLEQCGYAVQLLEFIDMSHTPKNILIRAVKKHSDNFKQESKIRMKSLLNELGCNQALEKLLSKESEL